MWVTADVRASIGFDLRALLPVKAGMLGGGSFVDL